MLSARKWSFASSFPCFQKISTGLFSFLLLGDRKFKFFDKKRYFLIPQVHSSFLACCRGRQLTCFNSKLLLNGHGCTQCYVNRLFPDVDATGSPAYHHIPATKASLGLRALSPVVVHSVVGMRCVNFMYQELQVISQHHLVANLSCLFPLKGGCPGCWDVCQRPSCPSGPALMNGIRTGVGWNRTGLKKDSSLL